MSVHLTDIKWICRELNEENGKVVREQGLVK